VIVKILRYGLIEGVTTYADLVAHAQQSPNATVQIPRSELPLFVSSGSGGRNASAPKSDDPARAPHANTILKRMSASIDTENKNYTTTSIRVGAARAAVTQSIHPDEAPLATVSRKLGHTVNEVAARVTMDYAESGMRPFRLRFSAVENSPRDMYGAAMGSISDREPSEMPRVPPFGPAIRSTTHLETENVEVSGGRIHSPVPCFVYAETDPAVGAGRQAYHVSTSYVELPCSILHSSRFF
jgi:hypothetical protein